VSLICRSPGFGLGCFSRKAPTFTGFCYGSQLLAQKYGGGRIAIWIREYWPCWTLLPILIRLRLVWKNESRFSSVDAHGGDTMQELPLIILKVCEYFECTLFAGLLNKRRRKSTEYSSHPEVTHFQAKAKISFGTLWLISVVAQDGLQDFS